MMNISALQTTQVSVSRMGEPESGLQNLSYSLHDETKRLYERVAVVLGIPCKDLRLCIRGRLMEGEELLSAYGSLVDDWSIVELSIVEVCLNRICLASHTFFSSRMSYQRTPYHSLQSATSARRSSDLEDSLQQLRGHHLEKKEELVGSRVGDRDFARRDSGRRRQGRQA